MGQKGFYLDSVICTGCKACQIACKDKNDLKVGELFREYSALKAEYFRTCGAITFP